MNGLDQEPVTIKENELYTIETAYTNNWMTPYVPSVRSDKKVAIIGSGPAGLALAHDLNRRGHSVTVFEKEDRIGGLLMYGIPNMKLEKKVIQRRFEILLEEGIIFKTNVNVGKDITKKELEKEYDASWAHLAYRTPISSVSSFHTCCSNEVNCTTLGR